MNAKTRRRLIVCLITVALTLPVESILLRALTTSDTQQVATSWVASLSPTQLSAASGQMELYPFVYRRAMMTALSPDQRATVWRNHIVGYIAAHPNLDASVTAILYNAASLATASTFSTPTAGVRSAIVILATQTQTLLGPSEASYLFYRLGPPDGTFASAEPIAQKLASYVRNRLLVEARTNDCDCNTDFGCDGQGTRCSGGVSCTLLETWPMCGWLWLQVCDGLCTSGLGGS